MKTSEVLNLAADAIEQRGWTVGVGGWPDRDSQTPVCLEGAIMAAQGWYYHDGTEDMVGDVDTCPAGLAVADYLNRGGKYLFQWNDAAGRTAAEVVEVLRAAAVIEAARESKAAGVSA